MPDYTFYDDFDGQAGAAPDPTKWTYDLGTGGWGNNELQTYTSSRANSYQDGKSNLVIAATVANGAYSSARLKTLGLFSQVGGSFEARIKINSQSGVWPAFWLMGQDITTVSWPKCGEVDVVEDFGFNTVQASVHTPDGTPNGTYDQSFQLAGDTNWHVYRMDLNTEGVTFFRDGYEFGHTPQTYAPSPAWVFGPQEPNNGGLFILLNVAVGGNAGTPPASTVFPATLLMDYVKVWQ